MTQEDKELLLKDLCARLPYGVIVDYKENEFEFPHWKITTIYPDTFDGWIGYDKRVGAGSESGSRHFNIGEIKFYLRPMSSMTDEEEKEFAYTILQQPDLDAVRNWETISIDLKELSKVLNWLNAHHFDYRGLIEMGLALEATENMYKNLK